MAEEVKMLSKDPNPDKLKNKMKIEEEWAQKIIDKSEDPCDAFMKALKGFKDPIQIWVKGVILGNADISCAKDYLDKARELGYSNDTKPNPMTMQSDVAADPSPTMETVANITNFPDGTMVVSTKDVETIRKINEILGPGKEKQVMQYPSVEDQMNSPAWDMFYNTGAQMEKPEYDNSALISLINSNHFLQFTYHNLATGELQKDYDMMYKTYVKGDKILMAQLKTFENYVGYVENAAAAKLPYFEELRESTLKAGLKDLNINKYAVSLNGVLESLRTEFENFQSHVKIEWKNIGHTHKIAKLSEKLSAVKLGLTEIDKNEGITEKLTTKLECTPELGTAIASGPVLEAAKLAADQLWIGSKEATALFNITLATIIKELSN